MDVMVEPESFEAPVYVIVIVNLFDQFSYHELFRFKREHDQQTPSECVS